MASVIENRENIFVISHHLETLFSFFVISSAIFSDKRLTNYN